MITSLKFGHKGRIGNQLFQFSALFALSQHLNGPIAIPEENIYILSEKTKYFQQNIELFYLFDLSPNLLFPRSEIHPKAFYHEPSFHYAPDFWNIAPDTSIEGYFQSEKYFIKYRTQLLQTLKFKQPIQRITDDILRDLGKDGHETVGLHVRRTDYITHGVALPESYYYEAIDRFQSQGKFNFFVVSDDIDWCLETFKHMKHVQCFDRTTAYIDMCLLASCHHNIVGNSSFSWWGSWLNQQPNRTVIAPKQWFTEEHMKLINMKTDKDVFCDHWTMLLQPRF